MVHTLIINIFHPPNDITIRWHRQDIIPSKLSQLKKQLVTHQDDDRVRVPGDYWHGCRLWYWQKCRHSCVWFRSWWGEGIKPHANDTLWIPVGEFFHEEEMMLWWYQSRIVEGKEDSTETRKGGIDHVLVLVIPHTTKPLEKLGNITKGQSRKKQEKQCALHLLFTWQY